jgi:hypothetical protein
MRRKKRKRFRAEARVPLVLPTGENKLWTMDFTRETLASGRKFRTLNLMDRFSREAPRIDWTLNCQDRAWCGCWKKWRKSGDIRKRFRWTTGRSSSVKQWTNGLMHMALRRIW